MELNIGNILPGLEFENFCNKLFMLYNLKVDRIAEYDAGYDFIISKEDSFLYYTQVKYFKSSRITKVMINKIASRLANSHKEEDKYLLIVASDLPIEIKEFIKKQYKIAILDISNILYLVQYDDCLNKEIRALMNDTVININNIVPEENNELSHLFQPLKDKSEINTEDVYSQSLINEFEKLSTGKVTARKYEELCTRTLKYLFEEYLAGWVEQNNTVDDLHRMDLICRVKRGNEFWDFIKENLNSRYVLFEFKNYTNQIKQTQVYTTEKYLYNTALRTVCFLISRKGASDSAQKAISGILRETGKVIIPLSDQDMVNLLRCKNEGQLPEDYLSDLLDGLLMKLSK